MSQWFTSDLHLGHKAATKYRPFETLEEMKERLYGMFDVVKKGDFVYILGDVAYEAEDAKELFEYLILKKKVSDLYVIEGNHDNHWMGKIGDIENHKRFHVCQTKTLTPQKTPGCDNTLFLSHYPQIIYNKSHYGAYQLHGHGHATTSDRPLLDNLVLGKRLNVNCELHDYKLWSREDIDAYMKSMPDNIDYYLCRGSLKQKHQAKRFLAREKKRLGKLYKRLGKIPAAKDEV